MKNWGVFIIMLLLVAVIVLPLTGCTAENEDPSSLNKLTSYYYEPHVQITGDVEEFHYLELEKESKTDHIYLSDLLTEDETEDLEGIMIVTRSSKSIYLNSSCLENYYFSIEEDSGLVSVCSDIDLHNEQAEMPVRGVQELVLCSANSQLMEIISLDGESSYIGFIKLVRSSGLFEYVTEAIFDDDFAITTYNKHTCLANKLLGNYTEAILTLDNGDTVYLTEESTDKMHWLHGRIYLTEYKSPVKSIEYMSE